MYIRPQLSRKRTRDMELLKREHQEELKVFKEKMDEGQKLELFGRQLANIYEELSLADNAEDKESILKEIESALDNLEKEYSYMIGYDIQDIEFSTKERISEMEEESKQWDKDAFEIEKMDYATKVVDSEMIRDVANELQRKYALLIEKSKDDLQSMMESAADQRNRIRKNITRRGG